MTFHIEYSKAGLRTRSQKFASRQLEDLSRQLVGQHELSTMTYTWYFHWPELETKTATD